MVMEAMVDQEQRTWCKPPVPRETLGGSGLGRQCPAEEAEGHCHG